ncbi:MAG: hypothetical protein IPO23_02285 [Flavobacterium sp.]|nr:hypothetical protein [Flavobacterium sp.]
MNNFTKAFYTTKSKSIKWVFAVLTLFFLSIQTSFGQTTVTLGGLLGGTCPFNPTATWTTPPAGLTFSNVTRGAGVTWCSAQ